MGSKSREPRHRRAGVLVAALAILMGLLALFMAFRNPMDTTPSPPMQDHRPRFADAVHAQSTAGRTKEIPSADIATGDATADAAVSNDIVVRILVTSGSSEDLVPDSRVDLAGIFPSPWTPPRRHEGVWSVTIPRTLMDDPRIEMIARAEGHLKATRSLRSMMERAEWSGNSASVVIPLIAVDSPRVRMRVVDASTLAPIPGASLCDLKPVRGGVSYRAIALSDERGIIEVPLESGPRQVVRLSGFLPALVSSREEPADTGDVPMYVDRHLSTLRLSFREQATPGMGAWIRVDRVGPDIPSAEFDELVGGVPSKAFAGAIAAQQRLGPGRRGDYSWYVETNSWECSGLIPGVYSVTAHAQGLGFSRRKVTLAGGEVECQLEFDDGVDVEIARGPWEDDVQVVLVPGDEATGLQSTASTLLERVASGEYSIELRFPGGILSLDRRLEVARPGPVVLDLSDVVLGRADVAGRITMPGESGTGSPVAGARVVIGGGEQLLHVMTDSEGRFELRGARTARYWIRVDGYRFPWQGRRDFEVPFGSASSVDAGVFEVQPSGSR